jgi:hypothetical protein
MGMGMGWGRGRGRKLGMDVAGAATKTLLPCVSLQNR